MWKEFKKYAAIPALVLLLGSSGCRINQPPTIAVTDAAALVVDSLIEADPAMVSLIEPYKENLDATMNRVLGYAARELRKGPVESALGNFVADLIEEKAEEYAGYPIDMGAVTIGGLRAPILEGPVKLADLYELMPFENMLWVLELSGEETQALFEYAAARKNIAISSSRLVIENDQPLSVTINGEPLDSSRTYTLAISDYLAGGGDDMFFLKDAKVLERLEVKLRDVIIEKVADLQAKGAKVDAEIEGRVVISE
jgi:2',3'-cyclic-nucleotide 2'-phosphodiesterase (5'-nucleotidase family)